MPRSKSNKRNKPPVLKKIKNKSGHSKMIGIFLQVSRLKNKANRRHLPKQARLAASAQSAPQSSVCRDRPKNRELCGFIIPL